MMLFQLIDVRYADGGGERIAGVSGSVGEGGRLAVVGPSGAGKSTLLTLMNRLIDPTGGSILYRGKRLTAYDPRALRREVVLVPQRPIALPGSVRDNVCYGRRLHRLPCTEEIAARWLSAVCLAQNLWDHEAKTLSGGELARLALARALALEPVVLLLDEVTAALDVRTAEAIADALRAVHGRRRTTIVFVTHDLDFVRRLADRVWVIDGGRLAEDAGTGDFFDRPRSSAARDLIGAWRARSGHAAQGAER